MGQKFILGFDLGGTKMLSTVIDQDFSIVGRSKNKVQADNDADNYFSQICKTIEDSVSSSDLSMKNIIGIGIAVPGPIDTKKEEIMDTPNLPLKGYPLKEKLEKKYDIPVLLENDVNAGTFGEFKKGAGKGFEHVIGIFPGTGIGGGLILNGKLYRGSRGGAGELGHMTIQSDGPLCGCGNYGCLEAVASKTAIGKDLVALASSGDAPTVFSEIGTEFGKVKSKVIYKAAEASEKSVINVVDRAAYFLGIGMANIVNIFNPEIIVIGGGIIEKFGKSYLKKAVDSMRQHGMEKAVGQVKAAEAQLGDDAVVIGAAALLADMVSEDRK
jgi:glucokinase